jgi:hypothetical protein
MDTAPKLEPIPRPPGHLLIGNLLDLDAGHPLESMMDLARQYGLSTNSRFQVAALESLCRVMSWSTSYVTNPASIRWWDRA